MYTNSSFLYVFLPLQEVQESNLPKDGNLIDQPPPPIILNNWQKWLLVAINTVFLLGGQSVAVILGKFYYDQGGESKWMATLVQSAAFPILLLPLFLLPSSWDPSITTITASATPRPSIATLFLVYGSLGLLVAADNMMYSIGFLYLSISTYTLLCATQLAFNAVFSFVINSQKLTALILNSVILLTLSATLVAIHAESTEPTGVSKRNYAVGFICTLSASAAYSLLLSLMQLSFQKVLKKETFSVVLEMQICTSLVATFACVVGLFASGEWSGLMGEMEEFKKGRVAYVILLVLASVSWQVSSVGVVGLIFVMSSLFSNVISTLALPLVPAFSVIVYHDKMDGVKIVAMLLAIWGFASYLYQQYLDECKPEETQIDINDIPSESCS